MHFCLPVELEAFFKVWTLEYKVPWTLSVPKHWQVWQICLQPRTPNIIPVCHTGLQLREDQPKLVSLHHEESNLMLFSSESVLFPLSTPSMGRFVSSSYSSIFSHQTALAALKVVLLFSYMLVTPRTMMYSTWLGLPQLLPAELCYKASL